MAEQVLERAAFAIFGEPGALDVTLDEPALLQRLADAQHERESGYIMVSTVRALAEKAGCRFDGSSEVNANPKDATEWQEGVWTLPQTFALGDKDKAKYVAIGESDRMTLRFVKPKHSN